MQPPQEPFVTVGTVLAPTLNSDSRAVAPAWTTEQTCRICNLVVAAFLCASFLAFTDGVRVMLVLVGGGVIVGRMQFAGSGSSDVGDPFRRVAVHFLGWMTARSMLEYGRFNADYSLEAAWWLFGTFLLLLFSWIVWEAARNATALDALSHWVGLSATLAAVASVLWFYFIQPGHVIGERLQNVFIYGGLNAVSTGLTFGFAAVWLLCQKQEGCSKRARLLQGIAVLVLLTAVLFTRSRGALLAVLVGYSVLTCTRGLRQMLPPWIMLATVFTAFALSGPVISRLAADQVAARARHAGYGSIEHLVMQRMQGPGPVREMVERKDSGRLLIYENAVRTLTTPTDWWFGVGQWGPGEFSSRGFGINHNHLHSAFFATLVHGGIIGLALFLGVLGIGLRRAIRLARRGCDVWLVLLLYGCAGLLFDGQTFTTLTSLPQMEALLVAFPLVAAASIGARSDSSGCQEMVAKRLLNRVICRMRRIRRGSIRFKCAVALLCFATTTEAAGEEYVSTNRVGEFLRRFEAAYLAGDIECVTSMIDRGGVLEEAKGAFFGLLGPKTGGEAITDLKVVSAPKNYALRNSLLDFEIEPTIPIDFLLTFTRVIADVETKIQVPAGYRDGRIWLAGVKRK